MDPKYIEGGWVRPAVEAVQPYVEEPYKIAQEMSIGDVLPGAGLLAKIGMAVPMGLAAKVPAMKMGKTAAKAAPVVSGVKQLEADLLKKYPDLKQLHLFDSRGDIELNMIAVDKAAQKQGVGSAVMQDITDFADGAGKRVVLTTGVKDPDFGTTSAARLKRFYKRFGFVENKGRNKDFAIKGNLLRNPQEPTAAKAAPEPPRRSLLEQLAEGVEDPGASARGGLGRDLAAGEDKLSIAIKEAMTANSGNEFESLAKAGNIQKRQDEIRRAISSLEKLDSTEKARLDRAVEQGFDLDAFHGTKGDIEAFDPGLLGETTGAPSARMGYFFAADPETAQTYARTSKLEDVRPSITNREQELIDKVYELEAAGDWEGAAKATEAAEAFSLSLTNQTGQNIMPVKLRLQNPLEHDFKGEGYRDVSYQTLLENAKNKGHDGAIFRNTRDGGGVTDIYVVFEPAQIRSRFAAFDPKDTPKTGLRQNAKLANEALQVNRKQLEVLVKSKKAVEREYSDLWAVSDIFNKKAELALAEKKSPALREDMLELSNNIKALQDRMDLLEDEARKVTIGTGDITASFAPLVLPLGGGTAAAAYLANQEQE